MTHIAITEPREGASVQWMEKVTDAQYSAASPGSEPQPSKPQQTSARPSGPVQQASDAARARAVNDEFGAVAPKFVELTNNVVFDDVWRRSDLSPRDRSLVTIAALAAMGDDGELPVYPVP